MYNTDIKPFDTVITKEELIATLNDTVSKIKKMIPEDPTIVQNMVNGMVIFMKEAGLFNREECDRILIDFSDIFIQS